MDALNKWLLTSWAISSLVQVCFMFSSQKSVLPLALLTLMHAVVFVLLKTRRKTEKKKIIAVLKELLVQLKLNHKEEAHILLNTIKNQPDLISFMLDETFYTAQSDILLQFSLPLISLSSKTLTIHSSQEMALIKGCGVQTMRCLMRALPDDTCPFPLHAAIQGGCIEVIELLLNDCSINEKDLQLRTPLHLASTQSISVLTAVLSHKDIKQSTFLLTDAHGNTSIQRALNSQCLQNATLLLSCANFQPDLIMHQNKDLENIFHCIARNRLSMPRNLQDWSKQHANLFLKLMRQKNIHKKTPIALLPKDHTDTIYDCFFEIVMHHARFWSCHNRSDALMNYLRKQLPANNSKEIKEVLTYCIASTTHQDISPSNQQSFLTHKQATVR